MVHKRDYISVSRINHQSNKTVTWTTDPATLFADAGACMLMPVADLGPLCMSAVALLSIPHSPRASCTSC